MDTLRYHGRVLRAYGTPVLEADFSQQCISIVNGDIVFVYNRDFAFLRAIDTYGNVAI